MTDLTHITTEVDEIFSGSDLDGYKLTLSGFSEFEGVDYEAALYRAGINEDDIKTITESENESGPIIEVKVMPDPLSLNRVLWQLGPEHFRSHMAEYEPEVSPEGFARVDSMPVLIGGLTELQSKLQYPEDLRGSGISGQVHVRFLVNRFGEVEEEHVIRSLHLSADKEALRVVREMKFEPGMANGVPVRVQIALPVNFRSI